MRRPVRLSLFLFLMGVGLALGFYYWHGPWATADRYQKLSTWGLGRHLGQRYPGGKVLVLSNPFVRKKETGRSIIDQEAFRVQGLIEGLQPHIKDVQVVFPKLVPGALDHAPSLVLEAQTTTPLSYLVAPDAVDDLLQTHPGTDIVVSLIGLPAELARVKSWNRPGSPRFAFLLPDFRFLGGVSAIQEAVRKGKMVAFVINHPEGDAAPQAVRRLDQEQFERHFLLVTEENLAQILLKWPSLLEKP